MIGFEFLLGGGFAIVAAAMLLHFIINLTKRQQRVIENHIHASTQTMMELSSAIRANTDTTKQLGGCITELEGLIRERL